MSTKPETKTNIEADFNLSRENVLEIFETWNNALKSEDASQVAKLYDEDAILIPTLSKQVRHNRSEIEDYFRFFLTLKPVSRLNESNIRIFGGTVIHSGIYTFSLIIQGSQVERQVRFTFVYRNFGGQWLIVEHHSSVMPEV